ncbi:MAG: dihydroorotate dehydrogenase electron transfer subunit [Chlorobi bacterium]|nr:dihydroorotate dehydrogenase electron transfer subunit [Chlorobiota bacterium]
MYQQHVPITRSQQVAQNVHILEFQSEAIAAEAIPGQFLNIRPSRFYDPFLRRAYSIHRVMGDRLEIIYNVVGKGSALFAEAKVGETLDILGPLGTPFHLEGEFRRAVLVSGGVGIAPMPFLGDWLLKQGKQVANIYGARTAAMIADDGRLHNARYATDDGSLDFHGNVVGLLQQFLAEEGADGLRVFACGPNKMLMALGDFCQLRGIPLEVSLECQMACGIGICQGCPVEMATGDRKYTLVCTHGPNYDYNHIRLESIPAVH